MTPTKPPEKPKRQISPIRRIVESVLVFLVVYTIWMVAWSTTDKKYLQEAEYACTTIHLNEIAPKEAIAYLNELGFKTEYREEEGYVSAIKKMPFWAGFGRAQSDYSVGYLDQTPSWNSASVGSPYKF